MARILHPIEAGYAAIACGADADGNECPLLIFDAADWRFELGAWAAEAVYFDPAVCGFGPEQMGFTPGWVKT